MKLRLSVGVILSLLLVAAMAFSATAAAGGSLDTTYGGTGKVTGPAIASAILPHSAIQKDDKVITVAFTAAPDFLVARHNTDGTLDATFGTGGSVSTDIGVATADLANAAAVQSDGKIVVAGLSGADFAVVRYNTDGTLDTAFDTDGKVTTDIGGGGDLAFDVAIQSDGMIVVAGTNGADFALARYTSTGALDTTFDTDGKVTTDMGGGSDGAFRIAVQSDGKIVVAGTNGADFALARYTPTGALDTTFDTDGKVTTDMGGGGDAAFSVDIDANGAIVAAGDNGPDFALARYTTAGALDTTFDTDGKVTTDFAGGSDTAFGVKVQTDGRIVAAGADAVPDFALARYNSNGALDTTFDTDGKVTTAFTPSIAMDVELQKDGKIVATGITPAAMALARYDYGTYLYRSDAIINKVGNDIYWGGQKAKVKVASGKSKTVKINVQNDGTSADSFMVHGSNSKGKAKSAFAVSYWSGSKNITKDVTKGTYETKSLATGEKVTIKMKIKAVGSSGHKTFKVSATSKGYAGSVDTVKAKAKIT